MTLDDAWIAAELAICEGATEGALDIARAVETRWYVFVPDRPGESGVTAMETNYAGDARFFISARTGYPAALKALREARDALLRLETIAKAHQGLCQKEVCHGDAIVDAIRSEYAALAKPDAPEEAPGEARD